ncbi:MAG: M2 family metallopeptidase [Phycisphaerae bacterium]
MSIQRVTVCAAALVAISGCSMEGGTIAPSGTKERNSAEMEFIALHDAYLAKYKPLLLRSEKAWWVANTTGSDEAFEAKKQAENALIELHSDRETFAGLKALKDGGRVTDAVLARQLDVMYRTFLPGQVDPAVQKRIVDIQTEVEKIFNTHRSRVGGKQMTENDVRKILSDTKDSALAEEAWKGYMAVGAKVEAKLKELVALRNQVARQLGFRDFYVMSCTLQEIDEGELLRLFDELDDLTREPFAALKRDIDTAMAARFGIASGDLRPWNFGDLFFQETPGMEAVNLDSVFADQDLLALVKKYYASLDMPVEAILARSDMYEKPGKSPHAFCTDLDRTGEDVRVLCNLKPNLYWMDTIMHEVGHAVYDTYIRRDLPFLLHEASHSITTEGVAMMFGAFVKNGDWLRRVRGLSPGEAESVVRSARRALRAEKLVFSRWTQVMVRFEYGMYTNPDQDLGKLWWDLKKRYQLLSPPETVHRPDYAAKVHVITVPVYYHSYMMGDLFASQLRAHIARKVMGLADVSSTSFYGSRDAGRFLKEHVFGPGNLYSWNELTRRATGEPLSARAFVRQYVAE